MEQFIKDKKKIGICAFAVIAIIFCGIKYIASGSNELKKNDNESIFVDDNIENEEIKEASASKSSNDNKKEEVFTPNNKNKLITVEIKGEVNKPDVYTLSENSIVKDLIEKADGLTENADVSNINRAKKLQDHELVYISNKNEVTNNSSERSNSAVTESNTGSKGGNSNSSNTKININTATVEELKKINGVGESKANNIIKYREANGGFSSIEDLKNVDGIGEKMFEKMKDYVEC